MPIRMPGDSPGASVNMEALSRTFMLAAPLLAGNPDEEIAGLRLRDYYAGQILLALDPASRWYVGDPLESARKRGRPTGTVDGAAIALGLWMAGPQLWDRFADAERAVVGSWLHAVAHGRTNSHNFRWFNVTMASFLATKGWEIDAVMVEDHLQNLLAYYAGDGWYRDAGNFDFYSSWAFQFYAPVWCAMYGNEHMPETATLLAANHNDLMCTYPALFGRDGTMPMWGRSICYRSAATVPLASAFLLNEPSVDPGWARRICSGSLLQFLTRDDVFTDGVATLPGALSTGGFAILDGHRKRRRVGIPGRERCCGRSHSPEPYLPPSRPRNDYHHAWIDGGGGVAYGQSVDEIQQPALHPPGLQHRFPRRR